MALVPTQSFPETWKPKIGAPVTVYTGGVAQQWRVNHIKKGIGTSKTIEFENSVMIVDKSWFTFDTNLGSLVLQRLGFFSDFALKHTTNSIETWRNILDPEKMMFGEALMVLLEWTIHGSSGNDKLGLPEAQSKTWLVDRSFWQSWEQKNELQHVPPGKCSGWVCVEVKPVWGTEVAHDRLRKSLDICFSEQTKASHSRGDAPLRQCVLPRQDRPNHVLEGVQLMTCDYIKGAAGHYMPLESFLSFRRIERMIAKIKLPIPIHLLDQIIIPINVRKLHWFPAHMNLQTRCISLLDSSHAYSAASYPQQKMLIWKNFKMVWTIHASTKAPSPSWAIHPARFTTLHPRMTDLTPEKLQTLGRHREVTAENIMVTINDQIGTGWKRRGISPGLACDQPTDPPGQKWTELEQPGTPQQNNFVNAKETSLACGIYTVLSSLYAVRNWKIDFVQQAHINNARNWMTSAGHAIKEVVSLHRFRCGESYEQWGSRPTPPCPTCEKTHFRKTAPDEKKTGRTGRAGKRTKNEESKDKGKKRENTLPHQTKKTRQSPTPHVFLDPTPGSRIGIPAASFTTLFQAPALRHETGIRYDSASKMAERRLSLARKPEQNVARSPSPTKSDRGLRNTRNTCFLNATIQCLGAIDEVNQMHFLTKKSTATQDRLLVCVRELQGPGTAYTPAPLIQQIPSLIGYKKGEPADAHELMIALINDISEPISQLFQGRMASTVK